MNISSVYRNAYENNVRWSPKKTKPIQTQSCPPEADFRKDKINLFSPGGGGLNFMHLRPQRFAGIFERLDKQECEYYQCNY